MEPLFLYTTWTCLNFIQPLNQQNPEFNQENRFPFTLFAKIYAYPSPPPQQPIYWRILSYVSYWSFQPLIKIMLCFLSIFRQKQEPITTKKLKSQNLAELFNQSLVYEDFRDRILSYRSTRSKVKFFYNNYNSESFAVLKNHSLTLLDSCESQDEKDLKASTATCDRIIDLYVQRFLQNHPELNQQCYLPTLSIVALGIVLKLAEDEAIWNIDFFRFLPASKLETKTYQNMEIEFLKGMDWNTSVLELLIDSE